MGDGASARSVISNFGPCRRFSGVLRRQGDKISGLSVSGDKLIIKLTKPFPALLPGLAMAGSRQQIRQPRIRSRTTRARRRGPYYISSREVGRNVVLDRNKNYKGTRPANPDRIIFR